MPKHQHKYDKLVMGALHARQPSGAGWAGRVNVTSQAGNLIAVTAPSVAASDAILLQTHKFAASSETVPFDGFVVTSINPGVGFHIGTVNSVAALVTSYQVSWMVVKVV